MLELAQKRARHGGVMAVALEIGDDPPLPGNRPRPLDDVPFGEGQTLLPHRALYGLCFHRPSKS
jgi:hypothetical protein